MSNCSTYTSLDGGIQTRSHTLTSRFRHCVVFAIVSSGNFAAAAGNAEKGLRGGLPFQQVKYTTFEASSEFMLINETRAVGTEMSSIMLSAPCVLYFDCAYDTY